MRSKNPISTMPTSRRLHLTPSRPLRLLALVTAGLFALSLHSPKNIARVASVSLTTYAAPAAFQPAQGVLNDLSGLDQLQQLFQNDKGKLRILALLSPT
jgi:hypothetical protein